MDIRPDHLEIVQDILREHLPEDVKVWVFGSRANWTTKDSSDLDLAVEGAARLDHKAMSALEVAFEESDLPYFVDVVDLNTVGDAFKRIVEEQRTPFPMDGDDANGTAANGWREVTLGDVATIVMGQSPPGKTVSGETGTPLLNGPTEFGSHHPAPVQFSTDPRKFAQPGDVLFCVRGSTTGRMNWADQEYAIGRGVAAIRHAEDPALQPLLRGVIEFALPELLNVATGSTFPNVSASQIAEIPYPDLSLQEQRAIAYVLGTLDDKIELNRRMNETLEAMARALFKSWFVDFEPVRAKMEGRWRRGESLPGLPADLYDVFPERLSPSELGEVPEGWEVGTISQLADRIFNGGTPKRSEPAYWEDGEVPWLTSGEVRQAFILETQSFISEMGLRESSAKMVPERAILVALYGATAGQVSMNFRPLTTNQAISAIIPNDASRYYCLVDLKLKLSDLQERAVGSAQQNLSKKAVETTIVLLPPVNVRARYNELVSVLFDRILKNLEDSRSLTEQRDVLLPGLVTGEVRVGDVLNQENRGDTK